MNCLLKCKDQTTPLKIGIVKIAFSYSNFKVPHNLDCQLFISIFSLTSLIDKSTKPGFQSDGKVVEQNTSAIIRAVAIPKISCCFSYVCEKNKQKRTSRTLNRFLVFPYFSC